MDLIHNDKDGQDDWGIFISFVWTIMGRKILNNHISAKKEDMGQVWLQDSKRNVQKWFLGDFQNLARLRFLAYSTYLCVKARYFLSCHSKFSSHSHQQKTNKSPPPQLSWRHKLSGYSKSNTVSGFALCSISFTIMNFLKCFKHSNMYVYANPEGSVLWYPSNAKGFWIPCVLKSH